MLTPTEVENFHRNGFLGPYPAMSPDEMEELRPSIEASLEEVSHFERHQDRVHNLHLKDRRIFDLCRSPAIVDRMKSILGEDLLLWRSNFFIKEPGGKEIPWHQDTSYWPIEPAIIVSAWLAIDTVDQENSCPNFIPGSHRRVIPTIPAGEEMEFHKMADPEEFDASESIPFIMKPGEFVIFNERALHQSDANRSLRRRMGLAIRVTVPQTRVLDYDSDEHGVIQLSGKDPLGFNRHSEIPERKPTPLSV